MASLEELRAGEPFQYVNDRAYDATTVNGSAGPSFSIAGGTDIGVVTVGSTTTINNTAPPSSLASAGGTESLVVDGTGPTLSTKGLTAGTGITLTPSATDITITAAGGSSASYGFMYQTAELLTTITAGNTPTLIASATAAGLTNGITVGAANRMTNSSGETKIFLIIAHGVPEAGTAIYSSILLAKNGVPDATTQVYGGNTNTSAVRPAQTLTAIMSLDDGDYIELWMENNTSTANMTCQSLSISMVSIA